MQDTVKKTVKIMDCNTVLNDAKQTSSQDQNSPFKRSYQSKKDSPTPSTSEKTETFGKAIYTMISAKKVAKRLKKKVVVAKTGK